MATKTAPEGFVYDGKHLIEAGLGTWHVHYHEDGSVKGTFFCPYPVNVPEVSYEQQVEINRAKHRNRR